MSPQRLRLVLLSLPPDLPAARASIFGSSPSSLYPSPDGDYFFPPNPLDVGHLMTLALLSLLDIPSRVLDSPLCPCSLLLLVCESVSKSCQLITLKCPLRAQGQSGWEVSLFIIVDLAVNLTEALRRNVKSSDKLVFVISFTPLNPGQS